MNLYLCTINYTINIFTMTFQSIIDTNNLTKMEILVLNFLKDSLKNYFGEDYSDINCKDISNGVNYGLATIKGVVGSLVKKGILCTYKTKTEIGNFDLIYFANQVDMKIEKMSFDEWANSVSDNDALLLELWREYRKSGETSIGEYFEKTNDFWVDKL